MHTQHYWSPYWSITPWSVSKHSLIHGLNNSFSAIHFTPSFCTTGYEATWHCLQQSYNQLDKIAHYFNKNSLKLKPLTIAFFFPFEFKCLNKQSLCSCISNICIMAILTMRMQIGNISTFVQKFLHQSGQTEILSHHAPSCVFKTLTPLSRWAFITPQTP